MRILFLSCLIGLLVACGGGADTEANAAAAVVEGETEAAMALPELSGEFVWAVDYEKSSVEFLGVQEGNDFKGAFGSFETVIRLNPDDLGDAEIHAAIDMASVDANDADRNAYLPAKDWFNTREFPKAIFVSRTISVMDDGTYEAAGELTIKGISQPMTLAFSLAIDGSTARATGGFTVVRTEHNVGEGAYADERTAAHEVEVVVDIYATR